MLELSSHNEWASFQGLLDDDMCDRIIEACYEYDAVKPEIVGEEYAIDRRRGSMRKLKKTPSSEWVYDLIESAAQAANDKYFYLALSNIVKDPEYVEYPSGDGQFDWHNDYGQERPISRRKMTVSIQLSAASDYEGGDLQLFDAAGSTLPRDRGTVSVFPSYCYHRVTPVTAGLRRALVGWVAGPTLV
jgi:PKHD-type hydroxylase